MEKTAQVVGKMKYYKIGILGLCEIDEMEQTNSFSETYMAKEI